MKKIVFCLTALFFALTIYLNFDFGKSPSGNCVFCDPKVIESQFFYRGKMVLAMLTHKPAVAGHVLIIPKRHVERFEELSSLEMEEIQQIICSVDRMVKQVFGTKDYILLQKNGQKAGQSVPHVHFHYIPANRFLTLRFFLSPWLNPLTVSKKVQLQEKLKNGFASI